ncbi:MAG: urea amidolyase family protein [Sandaracinaceae bacterium]|nr:urea amidolyase family protein [Sandaracinaceae bacterium]
MSLLSPFGPRALLIALAPSWEEDLGGRVALSRELLAIDGVEDACVTETSALVIADLRVRARLEAELGAALARCEGRALEDRGAREIDVVYDGADLETVASELGLRAADVIERHARAPLHVSFLGFAPGFAYLRGLDPRLASIARRTSPRPRVPASSVAIAAGMSAIYPAATPGGWQLLGHALGHDPLARPWRVGEAVRCRPVDGRDRGAPPLLRLEPHERALEVVASGGMSLVVDGAPTRRLADGAPSGGPIVRSLAARACRAVGATEHVALLERYGNITLRLLEGPPTRLADESGRVHTLRRGEDVTFSNAGAHRVGYVAIEGGLDVPAVLGGRGVLLSHGRGGLYGRPLRRGDLLPIASQAAFARRVAGLATQCSTTTSHVLLATPGPDLEVPTPLTLRCRIARESDRVGTRLIPLDRPVLPTIPASAAMRSRPMIRGAIQAPPSGELVALGPDHPVTGGYPVLALLDDVSTDALFMLPVGREITLRIE